MSGGENEELVAHLDDGSTITLSAEDRASVAALSLDPRAFLERKAKRIEAMRADFARGIVPGKARR
jgi:hypothetical protein